MLRSVTFTLIIVLIIVTALGQERRRENRASDDKAPGAVEIKDDRFSGKRTVRMLPVKVADNLEMALMGEVNLARKPDYMEQDLGVSITAEFTTPYTGGVNFGYEMDFGFLVDGKRTVLRTSGARTIINPYADRETEKQKAVAVLMQSTMERVAAGRKVEMKLGETEIKLDESVLKSIREFVKALSR